MAVKIELQIPAISYTISDGDDVKLTGQVHHFGAEGSITDRYDTIDGIGTLIRDTLIARVKVDIERTGASDDEVIASVLASLRKRELMPGADYQAQMTEADWAHTRELLARTSRTQENKGSENIDVTSHGN